LFHRSRPSPRARTRGALAVVALVAALVGAAGCKTQCNRDPDEPPVVFTGGSTAGGVYESSSWAGEYLDFPPGRTYRFVHDLGGVPRTIEFYFSFSSTPVPGPDADPSARQGGTVPAAGNQATIEAVTAKTFDVRNDSCSDIHLRVVARDPWPIAPDAEGGPTGPTDAGADADAAP
jgi:hypothetical protein